MSDHATSESRTEHARPSAWLSRSGVGAVQRALAVATAVLLGIDAYVHLDDAHFYDSAVARKPSTR